MTKAIIIGAGIGGLASAIRLARLGFEVEIFESTEKAGGKISERVFSGYRFDAGPSLFTLPNLVLDLLDEDFQFKVSQPEIVTKYFYPEGIEVRAFADKKKFSEEIELKLQVPAHKIDNYLKKASVLYELISEPFLFTSFHRLQKLLNFNALKSILNIRKLNPFSSLHEFNMGELSEKHLVQLFDRYATYNGSNPYQTPATLSVISHLEHNLGAFLPEGGMHRITQSLVDQALRLGVKFHFSEPVFQLYSEKGKVTGVRTSKGYSSANIVVSDLDILGFYTSIFPDVKRVSKIKKEERSSSALIFYWGMKDIHPQLEVHNIFFSSNYKEEFIHLFGLKDIFNDPTVYIYVSSKYNPTDAPEGCENWFVMINAPADIGQDWGKMIELARQNILNKLEKMLGMDLSNQICCEENLSPSEIFRLTGSINGSLYGNSSNNRYASFKRQANYSKDIKGLYFVGGTVHPGGGIPLCLSSAKIVEGLVKEDLESILTSK